MSSTHPRHGSLSTTLLAAAATVALFASAGAIQAQEHVQINIAAGGPGGMAGAGGMITKSKLAKYQKLLGLDDSQAEAAKALHEGYLRDHAAASKDFHDKMSESREPGQAGVVVFDDSMGEFFKKHGEKSARIEAQFLDDLKSLLTADQTDKWPRLERLRRRDMLIGPGPISGANVDVIAMVDGLKLADSAREKIAEPLGQYELDIDRALQDREQALSRGDDQSGRAMRVYDGAAFEKRLKTEREHGLKIRDLNRRYVRQIAAALPDDLRAKFENDVQTRSFRQAYRTSPTSKELDAAAKLDDLTPDQKRRVEEIASSYRERVKAAAAAWAAAQEKAEEDGKASGMGFGPMGGGGSGGSPDLAAARKARKELDKQTDEQLAAVLKPDQQARLPERKKSGGVQMLDGVGGGMVVMMEDEEDLGEEGEEGGVVIERRVIAVEGGALPVPGEPPMPPESPAKEEKKDQPK